MNKDFENYFAGKSILFFFAHPDDETLAAGATLNKLNSINCKTAIAIPNTGINSRIDFDKESRRIKLEELRIDTYNALSILGVKEENIFFGEFSDNAIDKHCLLDLIQWLEKIIKKVKPDIIFTHHRYCTNIDHQYCHQAAIVACRPQVTSHIDIICGEVPSSTGYLKPTNWDPNLFIEITSENLDLKVKAMLSYKGEARPDPHPRSPEVLKALAKVRGSEGGYLFAEGFMANKIFI